MVCRGQGWRLQASAAFRIAALPGSSAASAAIYFSASSIFAGGKIGIEKFQRGGHLGADFAEQIFDIRRAGLHGRPGPSAPPAFAPGCPGSSRAVFSVSTWPGLKDFQMIQQQQGVIGSGRPGAGTAPKSANHPARRVAAGRAARPRRSNRKSICSRLPLCTPASR